MILAIVLSALVLFGWSVAQQLFLPDRRARAPDAAAPPIRHSRRVSPATRPSRQPAAGPAPAPPPRRPGPTGRSPRSSRNGARAASDRDAAARGSINLRGARIDDLVLTSHREGLDRQFAADPPVLARPVDAQDAYFASFGWTGAGDDARPTAGHGLDAPAAARPDPGHAGHAELGQWPGPDLPDRAGGRRRLSVHRRADGGQSRRSAGRRPALSRSSAGSATRHDVDSWTSHVGPVGVFNGAANYDNDYATIGRRPGPCGSATSRAAGSASPTNTGSARSSPARTPMSPPSSGASATTIFQADFSTPERDRRRPVRRLRTVSYLFAGAKEIQLLNRYTRPARHRSRPGDRLGLVRLVHEADLLAAELAVLA